MTGKSYIGLTSKTWKKRWDKHCWLAAHGSNGYFHRAIAAYGIDAWCHVIVEADIATLQEANEAERKWILHYRTFEPEVGYNLTLDGESPTRGTVLSEEHKAKIGDANRGRRHSEVSRRNMSEARKGVIQTEKTRLKRGESLKGRIVTDSTRQKIREKRLGKKMSEESRKKMSEKAKARWARRKELT